MHANNSLHLSNLKFATPFFLRFFFSGCGARSLGSRTGTLDNVVACSRSRGGPHEAVCADGPGPRATRPARTLDESAYHPRMRPSAPASAVTWPAFECTLFHRSRRPFLSRAHCIRTPVAAVLCALRMLRELHRDRLMPLCGPHFMGWGCCVGAMTVPSLRARRAQAGLAQEARR